MKRTWIFADKSATIKLLWLDETYCKLGKQPQCPEERLHELSCAVIYHPLDHFVEAGKDPSWFPISLHFICPIFFVKQELTRFGTQSFQPQLFCSLTSVSLNQSNSSLIINVSDCYKHTILPWVVEQFPTMWFPNFWIWMKHYFHGKLLI